MSNTFGGVVGKIGGFLVEKSPTILMILGVGGCISATVIAVKETPKAIQIIENKKKELEVEKLDWKETVKATWKLYLPVVVTGGLSIACIIFSHSLNEKRKAALATLYTISETAMNEYRERIREEFPEKDLEIMDEVNEKIEADYGDVLDDIRHTPVFSPEVWIKEPITGQEFYMSENEVRTIINELNERMVDGDNCVTVNDYLDELKLNLSEVFGDYEWHIYNSGTIKVRFPEYIKRADGLPMLVMQCNFPRAPIKYGD